MLRRLLLAGAGGSFTDMGYSMSADEVTFWQEQAALLDPLAYEYVFANSTTRTVTASEHWFLVNGWKLDAGSGGFWYHRPADVNRALRLASGTSVITGAPAGSTAFMYLCKPSLVTGSDSRYTSDPRALYFDRIERLQDLTQYRLGAVNTGSGQVGATFPTDFTNGFLMHTSTHDIAWTILSNATPVGVSNTHNELNDTSGIRWAEPTPMPFVRTTMPRILTQGASLAEGEGYVIYVKLPGDW